MTVSRRRFLQTASLAAGSLVLGFSLPRAARAVAADPADPAGAPVTAWLRIAPDDTIAVMVSHAEMGQGIYTSLPMQIAEELEADWQTIRPEIAPADPVFTNLIFHSQGTGGSTSTRESFDHLRKVGAQAREMLRQAAATRWGVPLDQCTARNGQILHTATGRSLSYGALADAASKLTPPDQVTLKDPKDWTILGKPTARLDTPAKTDGSAGFGIDVKLPGMLVGTVMASPVFGGKLKRVDEAAALAVSGVHSVVKLDNAVVVVADGYWPARVGADALKPEWDNGDFAKFTSDGLYAIMTAAFAQPGGHALAIGDAGAIGQAARKFEADYQVPYLAHATMEPMNATVRIDPAGAEIWVPTQSPAAAQGALVKAFGYKPEQVKVHSTFLGGGFGRRSETDFVLYAAHAAKATGRPVKVIWSREEDMQHDFYRPAAVARMSAALDASGMPTAFSCKLVLQSIRLAKNGTLKDGVDGNAVEGMADMIYRFPTAAHVDYVAQSGTVPIGFWRSVGHSHNTFFLESFIDELAHAGGKDPVALRRALLAHSPRHVAVLDKVAEASGWGQKLPPGHYQGIAFLDAYGTVLAQVAEITMEKGDKVRVHKVTAVVDPGRALNPTTVTAQIESAIAYGLTAALYGEISINGGRVDQANFDTYQIVKMPQMPAVEVHIIESGEPPGGMGEPGTPPIAPAVANAIFAATGKRLRGLPLMKAGLAGA